MTMGPCSKNIVWDEKSEKLGRFMMKLTLYTSKGLYFILFPLRCFFFFNLHIYFLN